MRVLIDGSLRLHPASGSFRYVSGLVSGLDAVAADDDEIIVLASADTEESLRASLGDAMNIDLVSTRQSGSLGQRLAETRRMTERLRVDLLHTPAFFAPRDLRCALLATVHDINFLIRFADWLRAGNGGRALRLGSHLLRLAGSTSGVVVPSHHTKHQLRRAFPPLHRRSHVIPYGQHHGKLEPKPFDAREPLIVSVGVLSPQKNLQAGLRAFAAARPSLGERYRYVIIGRNEGAHWQRDLLPLAESLGVAAYVDYLGEVTDDTLYATYERARLLLLVSRGEGYGLPAVEALGRGMPVIGSTTTALAETCGGAAVLVHPDDHIQLTEEIVRLLSASDRWAAHQRLGLLRGRRGWDDVASDHLALYRRLAG